MSLRNAYWVDEIRSGTCILAKKQMTAEEIPKFAPLSKGHFIEEGETEHQARV